MKPNLFRIACNELSQDGVLTWLLQWADPEHEEQDAQLHRCAQGFVRLLLNVPVSYSIHKVVAGRQWKNIDIWAEINNEFSLIIEDKLFSSEHSDQLETYRKVAKHEYESRNFKIIFVLMKSGNESLKSINAIEEKGWRFVSREILLKALENEPVENAIFKDYVSYLQHIEFQTRSHTVFTQMRSNWHAAEGFFLKLQHTKKGDADWGYVHNASGGFLGFWYHWNSNKVFGEIYIQIENAFERGLQLVVKVGDWNSSTDILQRELPILQALAQKHTLALEKPARFRSGATSTVAVIHDAFIADELGNLDWSHLLFTLEQLEATLDTYCIQTTS